MNEARAPLSQPAALGVPNLFPYRQFVAASNAAQAQKEPALLDTFTKGDQPDPILRIYALLVQSGIRFSEGDVPGAQRDIKAGLTAADLGLGEAKRMSRALAPAAAEPWSHRFEAFVKGLVDGLPAALDVSRRQLAWLDRQAAVSPGSISTLGGG